MKNKKLLIEEIGTQTIKWKKRTNSEPEVGEAILPLSPSFTLMSKIRKACEFIEFGTSGILTKIY